MAEACTEKRAGAAAAHPRPKPSRMGRWRALVLVAVHVAIGLHVWHWHATGETMSPLEPSESMAFSQRGIVNAGLIFFGAAILSTLVFGRWFCGWACHLVAVQDGANWLLRRVGIRPRAVNLGLLASVPWLAFVYMFLSPLVLDWLAGGGFVAAGTELQTEQFWRTFPPWPVAVLSLLVCGVAIVYVLGAKGFCTYGCPYGAIFGIADQLAPSRIRVTDACSQCGHCTVACTSNVNVSQEVRDWGMVVDPGCMKCADCVSVCPKDALYVGWGRPAIVAARRRPAARGTAGAWARWLLLLAFMFAAFTLLHLHDGRYGTNLNQLTGTLWKQIGVLSLGAFAVAFLFRGKARHTREVSLGEETLLGASFLLALYSFRGLHGWSPLLLSLAVASILAWASLEAWRLVRSSDLTWKSWRLKREGRLTRAGVVFACICGLAGLAWGAAAWEQRRLLGEWRERLAAARVAYDEGVTHARAGDPARAGQGFARALELDPNFLEALENLAGMLCASGNYREGLARYDQALEIAPRDAANHVLAAQAALALDELGLAEQHLRTALSLEPGLREAHLLLAELLEARGDTAGARREREAVESGGTPRRP